MNSEEISKLSDFELNKAIAELIYPELNWVMSNTCYDNTTVVANSGDGWKLNYCNNWNDLMPLVVEHEISLNDATNSEWIADTFRVMPRNELFSISKNPQRALAECLLLVLQDKENKE